MKKFLLYILIALSVTAVASCNKVLGDADEQKASLGEIVLDIGGNFSVDVETKATALTEIPSTLYWGATTGSSTEAVKWSATSGTVSSSKINTGKYQTLVPTAYNYYVASKTFSVGAETTMTVANNSEDIVAGRLAASSSTTPSVTLEHIFSRTGTITLNTQSGYTISNDTFTIVGKSAVNGTAGTYNLRTGAWTAATTKLATAQALTSSSDMYLIPGTYTITFNYTLTKGDWTSTFSKTADVTLVKGKINNITATAVGGAASEIIISLSLASWSANNITATL